MIQSFVSVITLLEKFIENNYFDKDVFDFDDDE